MDLNSITDPAGMGGWVGLVGWPIADTLPTGEWVEFNAPPDTIQVISEADILGVLYISYSVVDDQRHK